MSRPEQTKRPEVVVQQPAAPADEPAIPVSQKIFITATVVLPAVGFLATIVLAWAFGWMGWFYLGMLLGGWLLTGLGITVGYHRLLSHRSFETYGWMRAFWMALGALAVQGSPLTWCAVHRRHHERSDCEGDPHSPVLHGRGWWNWLKGAVHSHIGWLYTHQWSGDDNRRYVPDLMKEQWLVRVDRLYYVWVLASLALPALLGGLVTMSWLGALLGFLWGGLARVFVVHHVTWSINSLCHLFGRREYDAGDESRNNVLCGVLALGEGWHNNHHAFPNSARHGLKWWQLDLSWLVIRAMQFCGLVWNVRLPSQRLLEAKRLA